jgi:hypothetical protein
MAMSSSRFLLLACAGVSLAGCNTWQSHIADESPVLGEAVAYDKAIQTINPAPVYSADSAQPGSNGDVGASAVKRYRQGAVKDVQTIRTAGTGGGSSGGGGPQ